MSRFNDNQDGTITDIETALTWQKKDSRQLTGRWMHLEKSQKLAKEQNETSFSNRDFGKNEIHIHKIFEQGGADCSWTDTVNGERAMMFSLVKGRSSWINKLGDGPFAVRLVRGVRKE